MWPTAPFTWSIFWSSAAGPIDAISHGGKDMYEKKVEVGFQNYVTMWWQGFCNHKMIEQKSLCK